MFNKYRIPHPHAFCLVPSFCKSNFYEILTWTNMSSESAFITDPEFCPECGTILPLPGDETTVTCKGCLYKVNVKSKFIKASNFVQKLLLRVITF